MRPILIAAIAASTIAYPAAAQDEPAVEISAGYVVDTVVSAPSGAKARAYWLDNLDVTLDADLEALLGWKGASAHFDLLNNLGGIPNDALGTLQGTDNIEVGSHRLRLFEAWIEQRLGERSTVRAGLYDLNSEFYANDAAGLLIAPAFGVGSEIAATGPNGPSIFPSTALAVRVDHRLAGRGVIRVAVLNASAGTLGDPGGVNLSFNDGALLIAEGGIEDGGTKLVIGGWGYTRRHDDIFETDAAGDPMAERARGAYLVAERALNNPDGPRAASAFVRFGVSDGKTTPFQGGWQAGVLVTKLWGSRPDSQISFGMNQGYLSKGYRALLRTDGIDPTSAETAFELTFSDKPAGWLTIQPDIQLILNPGGDRDAGAGLFGGLRFSAEF